MINVLTCPFLAHHKYQQPLRDDLNVSVFRTCASGLGAGRRPRYASWTVHLTGSDGRGWQRIKALLDRRPAAQGLRSKSVKPVGADPALL